MNFSKYIKKKSNLFWLIIGTMHIILMISLYKEFGFSYGNEGAKYLQNVESIVSRTYNWHFNYNSFYLIYELYLAIFLLLKIPMYLIFFSTYILSMWAYSRFYIMLQKTINTTVAKVWVICMLLSPMLQYWQFNLFSETFFIALSLLFISLAFNQHKLSIKLLIMLSPLLLFSRPNALFIVFIGWLIIAKQHQWFSKKALIVSTLCLGITASVFVIFYLPLPFKDFTQQLTAGAIYCGFPTLPYPTLPEGHYTLWNCYSYIYQQYGLNTLLELFLKKSGSFFVTSRPYYSVWHNGINKFHHVSYVLCIIPFFNWKKYSRAIRVLIILLTSLVLLNALMVGFIYNEWSERHTIQVFPFVFVGVAMAFEYLYKKLFPTL